MFNVAVRHKSSFRTFVCFNFTQSETALSPQLGQTIEARTGLTSADAAIAEAAGLCRYGKAVVSLQPMSQMQPFDAEVPAL